MIFVLANIALMVVALAALVRHRHRRRQRFARIFDTALREHYLPQMYDDLFRESPFMAQIRKQGGFVDRTTGAVVKPVAVYRDPLHDRLH